MSDTQLQEALARVNAQIDRHGLTATLLRQLADLCIVLGLPAPSGGGTGGEDMKYVHEQATASAIWTVSHNLNQAGVQVQIWVWESGQLEPSEADITLVTDNQLTITFSEPTTGRAVVD